MKIIKKIFTFLKYRKRLLHLQSEIERLQNEEKYKESLKLNDEMREILLKMEG